MAAAIAFALLAPGAATAKSASCNGQKATIKPKGKSGKTKRLKGTNGDVDVIGGRPMNTLRSRGDRQRGWAQTV